MDNEDKKLVLTSK